MRRNEFKFMFVFINDRMRTNIPLNIAYLTASLKAAGLAACVFDTSFYKEHERIGDEKKKEDAGYLYACGLFVYWSGNKGHKFSR